MPKLPLALVALVLALAGARADNSHWIAAWTAAPSPQLATAEEMAHAHLGFDHATLREIVHPVFAGRSVRVRLSNAFGPDAVEIASAHLGRADHGAELVPGSNRPITFGGQDAIRIPAGAVVVSDPVALEAAANSDLAISLYVEHATGAGLHYGAMQISYVASGDKGGDESWAGADPRPLANWVFLAGVDVLAPPDAGTVVAFGDSITDGAKSTSNRNRRWPNLLADRLLAAPGGAHLAVVNEGIGGNRVLRDSRPTFGISALERFDRDVLAQPGVRAVIVLEGINDIGHPGQSVPLSETVTAADLVAGYRQLIARAHEAGLKIFGATLLPFEGAAHGYHTPEKEAVRAAVNAWIRTGGEYDGVIDFDATVRDPDHPLRIQAGYDSGDHLHPNDAGYQAMANAIDLGLFKGL